MPVPTTPSSPLEQHLLKHLNAEWKQIRSAGSNPESFYILARKSPPASVERAQGEEDVRDMLVAAGELTGRMIRVQSATNNRDLLVAAENVIHALTLIPYIVGLIRQEGLSRV